jgi:hypothetical protein
VLLALLPVSYAHSATEVVPQARITAETNDNPRLRADDEVTGADRTASRLVAEVGLSYASFGPRGELSLEPAIRSDTYADALDDELESTDLYLRSRGQRRWSRAVLGFSSDLSREKIVGTEFLEVQAADPADILDVDGVLVGLNEIRTRAVLSPYTEVEFGERSAARLDLRAMDISYDGDPMLTARTDFTDWEAGAAYVRELSARNRLSTRVFGGRYEAVLNRNTTDTIGVEVRVEREVSDLWSFGVAIGAERSEYAYLDAVNAYVSGTHDDLVVDLGLRKRTERSTIDLQVRRRTSPDSFGFIVVRNELFTALRRDLSPRLRGGVVVRVIGAEALGGALQTDRDYGRLEFNIDWALSYVWSLVAGYQHSYWDSSAVARDARSNSVLVGFDYRGRTRR